MRHSLILCKTFEDPTLHSLVERCPFTRLLASRLLGSRLLVFFFGIILSFSTANAYEVSTDLRKKNILLEVFTGIHCGNCPDGDLYTDNLQSVQPEHVFPVDIHSGHYAVPNEGQPDYRIDEGEAIDLEMGADKYGYPCAAINRRHFPQASLLVLGRGEWMKKSKSIHEEDAPVNLHLSSVFDGETRELRVTVEGYYTQPVDGNENLLTVMLIQDNIRGYQSGAADRYNYNHRHMLRALLTPLWGDTIPNPQPGDYFTREYTYPVPAAIKDIPMKPEDFEILAFVSAAKREVLNVTGQKPEYIHYTKPLSATLMAPKTAITGRYGYCFFDAILKSETDRVITEASFQVTVNGRAQIVNLTGEIAAFHTQSVRLPVEPYAFLKENEYEIRLIALNGETFAGNALQGNFSPPVETTPTIHTEIKTDLYADENTFLIRNSQGEVVRELGPYLPGLGTTYIDTLHLDPSETYCFEIADAWGDGIMSPRGLYKLYRDDHTVFVLNYEVRMLGDKAFFRTTLPTSVTAPVPVEQLKSRVVVNSDRKTLEIVFQSLSGGQAAISLYSIDGKRLLNRSIATQAGICTATIPSGALPSGIYFLRISRKEKIETLKIWIQ
jgi:hypothetical protein